MPDIRTWPKGPKEPVAKVKIRRQVCSFGSLADNTHSLIPGRMNRDSGSTHHISNGRGFTRGLFPYVSDWNMVVSVDSMRPVADE